MKKDEIKRNDNAFNNKLLYVKNIKRRLYNKTNYKVGMLKPSLEMS